MYPKVVSAFVNLEKCTRMLLAALFAVTKNSKQTIFLCDECGNIYERITNYRANKLKLLESLWKNMLWLFKFYNIETHCLSTSIYIKITRNIKECLTQNSRKHFLLRRWSGKEYDQREAERDLSNIHIILFLTLVLNSQEFIKLFYMLLYIFLLSNKLRKRKFI